MRRSILDRFLFSSLTLALFIPGCGGNDGGDGVETELAGATEGSSDGDGDSNSGGSGNSGDSGDSGDTTDTGDTGDTGDDPPPPADYALGRIVLSEAHTAGGGVANGSVFASFVPDAKMNAGSCTREVAGCEISLIPECLAGCGDGEYCGFDDGCQSACLDYCDAPCDDDEVCYFAAPGQSACRKKETFDAGSLTFSGTTTPITLFPPYVVEGLQTGSPYNPGSEVSVSASGATDAGFEAFDVSFGTTQLIQAQLDQITVVEAYGASNMPVRWQGGSEDVTIQVTVSAIDGAYGTVTCEADDTAGQFDVPRQAIEAAVDGQTPSSLSVAVTRTRMETSDQVSTRGELLYAMVYPDARLELMSSSTESASIEGCDYEELLCGTGCVDVQFNNQHCGGCNQSCAGECQYGECLVENTNELCSDGSDNDQDGYYDCDDFDCSQSASVTVCDTDPSGGGDTGSDPGPNSCIGHCNNQAPGGCYCDTACVSNNDCCADYQTACP